MKIQEKILYALASLIKNGDRHITGYKLAKEIGIERAQVYRCLNQTLDKHSPIIDDDVLNNVNNS